jgi:hypothetical protein
VHTALAADAICAASEERVDEQNEIGRRLAERSLAEAARVTAI